MKSHTLTYWLIRAITFPLSFLPFNAIHFIGKGLGNIAYHVMTKYRKRTLSNLSLAQNSLTTKKPLTYRGAIPFASRHQSGNGDAILID